MNRKKNKTKGFTLIEVMVALMILIVTILGLYQMAVFAISQINSADYRLAAVYQTYSGVEIVRNIRDTYLKQNLNYGWYNPGTPETDSFVELVSQGNTSDFKISYENGRHTLVPILDVSDLRKWEHLEKSSFERLNSESGAVVANEDLINDALNFYRKVHVEDIPSSNGRLKRFIITVRYESKGIEDEVSFAATFGDIAVTRDR